MTEQNRLLTPGERKGIKDTWFKSLPRGDGKLPRDLELEAQREMTLKEVGEWLEKHCRGYHKGNYGGEFGHFGIYRKEIEALKQGKLG